MTQGRGGKFYREIVIYFFLRIVYFWCAVLDHPSLNEFRRIGILPDFSVYLYILDCERKMISQLSVNVFNPRLAMVAVVGGLIAALLLVSPNAFAEQGYVGDDVVEIQRVSQGKFRYPRSAARREIEGEVIIEFNVGVTGEVTDAFVVEATPPNRFEKNALKYVRSWVYEPLRLNGVPTEVQRRETKVIYRLQR
jgi:TonB family protein